MTFWVKDVQRAAFSEEMKVLKTKNHFVKNGPLKRLNAFLDEQNILRVGGRLESSYWKFEAKHPAILPKDSPFSILLVKEAHISTLHGGPQLTLAYLRQKYWLLNGRNLVRRIIHHCLRCLQERPILRTQLMANLPASRVNPSRAFLHTGVDYAGPINLKSALGRRVCTYKGYVAVFVCLSTKAVHLEAVTSPTTDDFLAAFDRFVSRRGLCSDIYSDRGTTFRGAITELNRLFREADNSWQTNIAETLAIKGIKWHFIPPYTPHFGGLWESAVKSFKHHFYRVVQGRQLTYEEICTLLAKVEACLNSRPLYALSNDPSDLSPLTPGHFLIGDSLKSIPEPNFIDQKPNLKKRWQFILQMNQHFWRRWSQDYLNTLQHRYKWSDSTRNIRVNDLVLVKSERLSPAKWLVARIEAVHPGKDGYARVATLRCGGTTIQRPVTKLCLLPEEDEASNP